MKESTAPIPSPLISLIPIITLVCILFMVIKVFGGEALSGASQVSLLISSAVCILIAILGYRISWKILEEHIGENVKKVTPALIILLLIGSIAGTWMLSGIVPSLIYYGLQIMHPKFFLAITCIICAAISIMTGSSWTTIATIGVAFIGIGKAQGFEIGWIAGAIISGAYFGDKISPLSDTTVLASSTTETPLFTHIRYMHVTTVPSIIITLAIFTVAGLNHTVTSYDQIAAFSNTLNETFHITPWLLMVPVITGVLIALRLPTIITLFLSTVLAAIFLVIFQPDILQKISGNGTFDFTAGFKGVMTSIYGSTNIDTGNTEINNLIATRGMSGMMNTIWLILCAMCFGGALSGSGMLKSITSIFLRFVKKPKTAVISTVSSGLFFNVCTADQYLSIILTGNLFKGLYKKQKLESRLLSRSVEDSVTVTSVLIPWNSCGMTQATVLGVSTLTYLPYCFFNILSPIMSIAVILLGYKIYPGKQEKEITENNTVIRNIRIQKI